MVVLLVDCEIPLWQLIKKKIHTLVFQGVSCMCEMLPPQKLPNVTYIHAQKMGRFVYLVAFQNSLPLNTYMSNSI